MNFERETLLRLAVLFSVCEQKYAISVDFNRLIRLARATFPAIKSLQIVSGVLLICNRSTFVDGAGYVTAIERRWCYIRIAAKRQRAEGKRRGQVCVIGGSNALHLDPGESHLKTWPATLGFHVGSQLLL